MHKKSSSKANTVPGHYKKSSMGKTTHKTGAGKRPPNPTMGGAERVNKQRKTRQGFAEKTSAHEGHQSSKTRTGTGKVYSTNYGSPGGKRADFQNADKFLGHPNDNKLTPANNGGKSMPDHGDSMPAWGHKEGPAPKKFRKIRTARSVRKGESAPPSPKRPKGSGAYMARHTTSYGSNRNG